MSFLPATLLLQPLTNTTFICRFRPFAFDDVLTQWLSVLDHESTDYIEGVKTYKRLLEQLHLYVCLTSDHSRASDRRTLLHRATDWMKMQKIQGEIQGDACIVPFASGGNGCFAGDYTGWPQGLGEYNAHRVSVTNNAIVAAFDTYLVVGAMQVIVGATTDAQTLPGMIQPSEIYVLQPACCCTCNLHVAAGIYRQPSLRRVATRAYQQISDYVDAPQPNQDQFQQYFQMQKTSTSVIMNKQDYLHLQHNQPAAFTTFGPTLALCFSKCADRGVQPSPTKRRKHTV